MNNKTPLQRKLLGNLAADWPGAEITWDEARGVAARVRFEREGSRSAPILDTVLGELSPLFGPEGLRERLREMRPRRDDLEMEHLRFWQAVPVEGHEPVELYGSRIFVHLRDGLVVEVQSGLWRDVEVEQPPAVNEEELRVILLRHLGQVRGIKALKESLSEEDRARFPMATAPRLVVFAWKRSFRLSWTAIAWGQFENADGDATTIELDIGPTFVDAVTGDVFLHSRSKHCAAVPAAGTGTRCTPLNGPFGSRNLRVARVIPTLTTDTYQLIDLTRARTIVTYDAAGDSAFLEDPAVGSAIAAGTLPVSEDNDGGAAWTRTPANKSEAERTASQQPEVDLHWFMGDIYDWYEAIGGRVGLDNDDFNDPPVPKQTLHAVAHQPSTDYGGYKAFHWKNNRLAATWLAVYDGDATSYDYFAGSAAVVAHEYQHAVTDFCFEDAAGKPGLPLQGGWWEAMHEGVSDVFGTLYEADWSQAADISHKSQIFRNAIYPRDRAAFSAAKFDHLDHWDDRNDPLLRINKYSRGTILAHCAYLMGSGGVHQRQGRLPELVPVYDLGAETVKGRSVLRAARIWYRALHKYFGNWAAPTGDPSNDATLFQRLRQACLSAASDLYATTPLYWAVKNTELAFYAVGLQPPGEPYGADCTFLPWGAAWRLSRPYIRITSPTLASVDLFVNNGGTSDWYAQVHISDPDFENKVYCRVRNVGDLDAADVWVLFEYAPINYATISSGSSEWLPVLDKNGAPQQLFVGTLAAGSMTFPDSQQNSPPASAMIKWRIPPIPAGERVDEFVLRARVSASNDVNDVNNEVRSNLAYGLYGSIVRIPPIDFLVRSPT